MGDRYRVEIQTLKKHQKVFEDLDFEVILEAGDTVNMINEEFKGSPTFVDMIDGVPYIAYFDVNEYGGPSMAACDGVDTNSCDTDPAFNPMVLVDDDGKVDGTELIFVQDAIGMRNTVRVMFAVAAYKKAEKKKKKK